MVIKPGLQFEPPYVGSYNQGVHGEGDPFADARSYRKPRFHRASSAMCPSPQERGIKQGPLARG